jgi:hypothetical protein
MFPTGVLTPKACTDRFSARMHQIEMAIIAESARWGDSKRAVPRTKDDDWVPDMNKMISTYFPARTGIVFNQFKGQGWWPSVEPPAMNTHGGHVAAGFSLQMTPVGTTYYTLDGTDPRVPGTASGPTSTTVLVPESAAKRVLVPTAAISDAWRTDPAFSTTPPGSAVPAASAMSAAQAMKSCSLSTCRTRCTASRQAATSGFRSPLPPTRCRG